ncbi:MAG: T4 family baseplate hub assembly chaperone [Candidatus Ranarchaeia archaeon]|jgi:hypothetical protein
MIISKTVNLPSEGKFYTGKLASGEIELKPFTAKEEDILSEQSSNKHKIMDQLLNSMIISEVNIDDLLKIDVDSLIISQRIISYGTKYDVQITCTKCEEQYQDGFDLKQVTSIDKEYQSPIIFKIDDLEIELQPETYGAHKSAQNRSSWLKNVIHSVNKYDDVNYFVDNIMLSKQAMELRKYFRSVMPELDFSKMKSVCPTCDTEMAFPLTLDHSFFGITPQYKPAIHKEIFNLAYYSQGAFNQEIAYKLPVHLRRFYLNELKEAKQQEADQSKGSDSNVEVSKGMVGPGGNLL